MAKEKEEDQNGLVEGFLAAGAGEDLELLTRRLKASAKRKALRQALDDDKDKSLVVLGVILGLLVIIVGFIKFKDAVGITIQTGDFSSEQN